MFSLKQEMRQKYEKHSAMFFYENSSGFEDGLIEKILNLAYANLFPFTCKTWNIYAVKSPIILQRLYKAVNDKIITESAAVLVICDDKNSLSTEELNSEIKLLALSISYAAKYYCIDHYIVNDFDNSIVVRELSLNRQIKVHVIICLGYFTGKEMCNTSQNNPRGIVKIL